MQANDPGLVTALLTMTVGMLMVHVGISKRKLAWRPRRTQRLEGGGGDATGSNDPDPRLLRQLQ